MKQLAGLMLILIFMLGVSSDGSTAPQVKTLTVNGTNLAYIEQGQGPPLMLVHGALLDYRYWAAQVEQFRASHRVIAVSLRHHYPHASSGDQSDYGPRVHAADVAALIQTLAVPPVHLVGHSYGDFVALLLARDHPGLVRSLVLEEPALLARLITNEQDKAEVQPILASRGAVFKETIAQLEAGNREDASTLGAPTLLVGGDASPRLYPLSINGLQTCLRTVEWVTIPQASHGVHVENPMDFNRAVLEFVGRH